MLSKFRLVKRPSKLVISTLPPEPSTGGTEPIRPPRRGRANSFSVPRTPTIATNPPSSPRSKDGAPPSRIPTPTRRAHVPAQVDSLEPPPGLGFDSPSSSTSQPVDFDEKPVKQVRRRATEPELRVILLASKAEAKMREEEDAWFDMMHSNGIWDSGNTQFFEGPSAAQEDVNVGARASGDEAGWRDVNVLVSSASSSSDEQEQESRPAGPEQELLEVEKLWKSIEALEALQLELANRRQNWI